MLSFERHPGLSYPWIGLRTGTGYFDRVRGAVVSLGNLIQVRSMIPRTIAHASVIDPRTVAFARKEANGYAIERLDLATGSTTEIARRSPAPTLLLLHVDDEKIVIGEGDELYVRRISDQHGEGLEEARHRATVATTRGSRPPLHDHAGARVRECLNPILLCDFGSRPASRVRAERDPAARSVWARARHAALSIIDKYEIVTEE